MSRRESKNGILFADKIVDTDADFLWCCLFSSGLTSVATSDESSAIVRLRSSFAGSDAFEPRDSRAESRLWRALSATVEKFVSSSVPSETTTDSRSGMCSDVGEKSESSVDWLEDVEGVSADGVSAVGDGRVSSVSVDMTVCAVVGELRCELVKVDY